MKRKKEKGERTTDEGSEEEKFPSGGWKSKEATEGIFLNFGQFQTLN